MTSTHRVVEREAWSRYWNKGLLHACASSFSSSYGGAIATFWQDQLIRYCNADQQIIDFGCGNGPIAMLLCEGLQDLPRYLGIDYAELAPQWLNRLHEQQRTQIRFLSPQDFRNLPIEDNAADWLVSQFGAEYGGLQAALSEALRVLKPGGRLLWMVHHHDSIIVRQAAEESGHIDFLCQPGGLIDLASKLLDPFSRATSAQAVRRLNANKRNIELRENYNVCLDLLSDRCASSHVPAILLDSRDWVSAIVQGSRTEGAKAAQQRLGELSGLLSDSKERLRQLRIAAQNEASMQHLFEPANASLAIDAMQREILYQGDEIIAWCLALSKPMH